MRGIITSYLVKMLLEGFFPTLAIAQEMWAQKWWEKFALSITIKVVLPALSYAFWKPVFLSLEK